MRQIAATMRSQPLPETSDPLDPRAADEVVKVISDRRYWAWRGLAAAGFACASVAAFRPVSGAMALFGIVGALLFGTLALYAARQRLRREPRLVLDATGFVPADFGLGRIPWTDVADIEMFGSAEAPFLALVLVDAERWRTRMPAPARMLASVHRMSGLPLLSVSLIGIAQDPWWVVQRGRAFWLDDAGPRA